MTFCTFIPKFELDLKIQAVILDFYFLSTSTLPATVLLSLPYFHYFCYFISSHLFICLFIIIPIPILVVIMMSGLLFQSCEFILVSFFDLILLLFYFFLILLTFTFQLRFNYCFIFFHCFYAFLLFIFSYLPDQGHFQYYMYFYYLICSYI